MSILSKIFGSAAQPEPLKRREMPEGSRPWSIERNEKIRIDRAAGMKTVEIAEKYNLAVTYVRSLLTRGMPRPPAGNMK